MARASRCVRGDERRETRSRRPASGPCDGFVAAAMVTVVAGAALVAAARPASAADALLGPIAAGDAAPPAPWHVVGLPQQSKPFTRFSVVDLDGRRALRVEADKSYGNLVHPLAALDGALRLSWRWRLETPLPSSDLREKGGDDTGVKVCVFFDQPLEQIPFAERQILRVARGRSSEPVPAATVCYVWDTALAPGTTLDNAFTRRMRYIVLQSGSSKLNQWVAERRDVAADFKRVFGAESPTVPPVIGIAVGADADNTASRSVAYVADVALER